MIILNTKNQDKKKIMNLNLIILKLIKQTMNYTAKIFLQKFKSIIMTLIIVKKNNRIK
jgi:hypothetical protein